MIITISQGVVTISYDNVGEGLTPDVTTENDSYFHQERTRKWVVAVWV